MDRQELERIIREGRETLGVEFKRSMNWDDDATKAKVVKAALAMLRQIQEEFRLPLVPINVRNRETLRATMKKCGVLK